jgi:hypothetical protein
MQSCPSNPVRTRTLTSGFITRASLPERLRGEMGGLAGETGMDGYVCELSYDNAGIQGLGGPECRGEKVVPNRCVGEFPLRVAGSDRSVSVPLRTVVWGSRGGTGILQPPYRTEVRSGERSVPKEGARRGAREVAHSSAATRASLAP